MWSHRIRYGSAWASLGLLSLCGVLLFAQDNPQHSQTNQQRTATTPLLVNVTGCLKNIAYGNFSNVARSHNSEKTHTKSFIGVLAAVEPVRSRVVLHIMDGLRGVWHAGPFSDLPQFRFYPKQMMFGTDPVAMDHKLIELIEEKRKAEGAITIFDRSMSHVGKDNTNPNTNHYIREPGHVEYASTLGLGVFDAARIKLKVIEL